MIVLVTDPITNKMVTDPKKHPFVIQGSGHGTTKIYFESQSCVIYTSKNWTIIYKPDLLKQLAKSQNHTFSMSLLVLDTEIFQTI